MAKRLWQNVSMTAWEKQKWEIRNWIMYPKHWALHLIKAYYNCIPHCAISWTLTWAASSIAGGSRPRGQWASSKGMVSTSVWKDTWESTETIKCPLVFGRPTIASPVSARFGWKLMLSLVPYWRPLACKRTLGPGVSVLTCNRIMEIIIVMYCIQVHVRTLMH